MLRVTSYRFLLLAFVLLLCGCFEGFQSLVTKVQWDPAGNQFRVERRLIGISRDFLRCQSETNCATTLESLIRGGEVSVSSPASQLRDRLFASGATDISVTLEPVDGQLNIRITYNAPLGTKAADETDVFVEWSGKPGQEKPHLIAKKYASNQLLSTHRKLQIRTRSVSGSGGLTSESWWVFANGDTEVKHQMMVDPKAISVLDEKPNLVSALQALGLLDAPIGQQVAQTSSTSHSKSEAPSGYPGLPDSPELSKAANKQPSGIKGPTTSLDPEDTQTVSTTPEALQSPAANRTPAPTPDSVVPPKGPSAPIAGSQPPLVVAPQPATPTPVTVYERVKALAPETLESEPPSLHPERAPERLTHTPGSPVITAKPSETLLGQSEPLRVASPQPVIVEHSVDWRDTSPPSEDQPLKPLGDKPSADAGDHNLKARATVSTPDLPTEPQPITADRSSASEPIPSASEQNSQDPIAPGAGVKNEGTISNSASSDESVPSIEASLNSVDPTADDMQSMATTTNSLQPAASAEAGPWSTPETSSTKSLWDTEPPPTARAEPSPPRPVPPAVLNHATPRVIPQPARVRGTMNASLANTSITELLPGMWQCYLNRLQRHPNLQGYLTITAVVRADGFITSTSVSGDLGDPELNQCVSRLIGTWALPSFPSNSASPSTLSVPILFWLEPHLESSQKRRRKRE